MALYKIQNKKLQHIKSIPFKFEKEIQTICESNLEEVFGLQFVKSELALKNFRIDTLAFDGQTKSFVIIEYKKDASFSVVDQGYAYLSLMLNNKAEFILEYNEKFSKKMKKKDIDWSQSRVLFVSPSFTPYQREAINFRDFPVELWEIRKYSNDTVSYLKIQATKTAESIKTVSKGGKGIKEIEASTLEKLIEKSSDVIKDACLSLREEIYHLDSNIEERPAKTMITYYSDGKGLLWIVPHKNNVTIHLRKGKYSDKYGKINPDGWGGYPILKLKEDEVDMHYLRNLIKQAYEF